MLDPDILIEGDPVIFDAESKIRPVFRVLQGSVSQGDRAAGL
jgi:hypothetical protein